MKSRRGLLVSGPRGIISSLITVKDIDVAKGQKKSNREQKKPKKTDAERLKDSRSAADMQVARMALKDSSKK